MREDYTMLKKAFKRDLSKPGEDCVDHYWSLNQRDVWGNLLRKVFVSFIYSMSGVLGKVCYDILIVRDDAELFRLQN